jgi:hypothetical protein
MDLCPEGQFIPVTCAPSPQSVFHLPACDTTTMLAAMQFMWRKFVLIGLFSPLSLAGSAAESTNRSDPKHFIFFGTERERINDLAFLTNSHLAGAQLKYSWRELEPKRDKYDFHTVLADIALLERHHKRLFLQLQDVTFSEDMPAPEYLRTDPAFHGGAARKFEYEGDDDSKATFDGWVARRWDPAVQERFKLLLIALGKQLDGRIEGINLPESAIGFGEKTNKHPAGFTYASYAEGIKANLSAARGAFPRSCVIQYANFMPGEWLPWTDHGYLKGVYAHAARIGAGVGGPDLLPHRKGQRSHSYPLIAARGTNTPAAIAVQDGNLADKNPATKKAVTVDELYRFATDELRVDYIFWGTEEPYYTRDVLPYIQRLPVVTPTARAE